LPGEIAALEAEIVTLDEILADAGLFARDTDAFNKAAARLDAAKAELAAKEERWLELEEKREAIGQSRPD
jgi:ATP-binding cassette subfamily F protein uup